jgi:serine/threonine protein kinase
MTSPPDGNTRREYRPLVDIGRGGMADVCLAVARRPGGFDKPVVIKQARVELAVDSEILAMFLDEARLAARRNPPNVVQTHEVGGDGDRIFIAVGRASAPRPRRRPSTPTEPRGRTRRLRPSSRTRHPPRESDRHAVRCATRVPDRLSLVFPSRPGSADLAAP